MLPGSEFISQLEHQLRTGFQAKANDISGPLAPLELRPRRASDALPGGNYAGARTLPRARWLVAVGTATVVVAIIASALAVADALAPRPPSQAGPVETHVPPYYVALVAGRATSRYPVAASVATVRATSTGLVIARIRAPRPYTFASVTAAANDRSFVLFAVGPFTSTRTTANPMDRRYAQRFFLLRINPAAATPSDRAQLMALPQAAIASGLQVEAMALSPNGQSLAAILEDPSRAVDIGQNRDDCGATTGSPACSSTVVIQPSNGDILANGSQAALTAVPAQLTIFNLADGAQRTWTRDVCGADGRCSPGPIGAGSIVFDAREVQLSWTSDGRSVLFVVSGPTTSQVRLLDVDSPGSDLITDSHVLPIRTSTPAWNDAVVTPDGKSVFIQYDSLTGSTVRGTLLRFSATTGRAAVVDHVLTSLGGVAAETHPDYLLWTNDDGSKFIVLGPVQSEIKGSHGQTVPSGQTARIYSGRRYAPLPWPAGVVDAAW